MVETLLSHQLYITGVCCFPKHEISSSVCSETGMWTDFQQCHPQGTELQEAESFTSIKLGNYAIAFVMNVGDLYNCSTLIGKKTQPDSTEFHFRGPSSSCDAHISFSLTYINRSLYPLINLLLYKNRFLIRKKRNLIVIANWRGKEAEEEIKLPPRCLL